MKLTARRIVWRTVKYLGIASIFIGVNAYSYWAGLQAAKDQFFRDWPNLPDCQLTDVARYPSVDGAYRATISKRSCLGGEFISYFLRVDNGGRQSGPGGWSSRTELMNDQYPVGDPEIVWSKKRSVQVTVSTRTISGTLVVNQGSDIEIVIVYQPREPGAFPNYYP